MTDKVDKLLKLIRSLTYEEAREVLVNHMNMLTEGVVERAWKRSRNLLRFNRVNKKRQLRKFILEEDEFSSSISLLEFNLYFFSVINDIQEGLKECETAEDMADFVEDKMLLRAGSLSLDRRMLAKSEVSDRYNNAQ